MKSFTKHQYMSPYSWISIQKVHQSFLQKQNKMLSLDRTALQSAGLACVIEASTILRLLEYNQKGLLSQVDAVYCMTEAMVGTQYAQRHTLKHTHTVQQNDRCFYIHQTDECLWETEQGQAKVMDRHDLHDCWQQTVNRNHISEQERERGRKHTVIGLRGDTRKEKY